ncbi:MAG: hypothetical protein NTY37_07610 [Methanothrix sp.]|nr:hypothetical protein [Methanothrix sp.]
MTTLCMSNSCAQCSSGCKSTSTKWYETIDKWNRWLFDTFVPILPGVCGFFRTAYETGEIWGVWETTVVVCTSCVWCGATGGCSCTFSEDTINSFYISQENNVYTVDGAPFCPNESTNDVLKIQSSSQKVPNKTPLYPNAYGHINSSSILIFNTTIEKNISAALFLLAWEKAENILTLEVYSPSGKKIEPRSTLSVYYNKNKSFELYIVKTPDQGNWSTRVIAKNLSGVGENYSVFFNSTGFRNPLDEIDRSKAKLNGIVSSYGNDLEKDGLVDYVTAVIGINVQVPGIYYVKGLLHDANNSSKVIGNGTYLNIGSKKILLNIFDLNTSGPYYIKNLELYDKAGNLLDLSEDVYKLKKYKNMNIRTPLATLTNQYKDYKIDANGDGLFESLRIDVGLNVSIPGNYSLMGDLDDTNDTNVAWSVDYRTFDCGYHTMHLDFNDKKIVEQKANGPYHLTNLILYMGSRTEGMKFADAIKNAYTTPHYNYTDFGD